MLHTNCITDYLRLTVREDPGCPECRGCANSVKNFKFVAETFPINTPSDAASEFHSVLGSDHTPPDEPGSRQSSQSPGPSNRMSGDRNSTGTGSYPWWPAPEDNNVYHAATRLLDGRHSLLIDPGAWSNLVGEKWAQDMARKAMKAGQEPTQSKLARPFNVQALGQDPTKQNGKSLCP